jgi:tight adherence protein B
MRRVAALTTLAAVALALPAGEAAAGDGLTLAKAGKARFPERSFALALPDKRPLRASQLSVSEDGDPVRGLTAVPATAAGRTQLGAVLVIDASRSMKGRPIEGAIKAARTFARQRNEGQPLGIVTFNEKTTVVLAPTTDRSKIDSALGATPELSARGTHIYDGVEAGVRALRQAGIEGGSVVLLSDGSDTGSTASLAGAASTARAAGVRLYTVGLRSRVYDGAALSRLAALGDGEYSEASSARDLARIYNTLGARLASQYVIRYRSLQGPRERVRVQVAVRGVPGVATASYVTPALRTGPAPSFERSTSDSFWRSDAALLATSVAAAALLGLGLLAMLRPASESRLRRRLRGFVPAPSERRVRELGTSMADKLAAGADESLSKTRWWAGFKEDLEISRVKASPMRVAGAAVVGALLGAWLLWRLVGPLGAVAGIFVAPLCARSYVKWRLDRVRFQFAEQLADHLQVTASAMRAGHSFVGALSIAEEDAPEPIKSEFHRALADEALGVPIEDALGVVATRMDSADLVHVALTAKLQRSAGANAAEVLDRVAGTIRERQELRRHVRALTAQQRLARYILTALPFVLLGTVLTINPDFLEPLFEEGIGRLLLLMAAVGLVGGSLIMKRIVDIKL